MSIVRAYHEKLKQSSLTIADAKKLKFELLTGEDLSLKYPKLTKLPAAGFTIPYFGVNGTLTPFYRYRYLEQPKRTGFAAVTEQKQMRYIQPVATSPRVYFPPLLNWSEYLARPVEQRSLIITEGELKAACACKMGIPVLGLGGVFNFTSDGRLLADLQDLPLEGVQVTIIYDSDAKSNPQVMLAENRLAQELLNLKAQVSIARLPDVEGLKKTGLDDFLLYNGMDALLDILGQTEPWTRSRALHKLNEEVLFVRDPGMVLEVNTLQRINPQAFTSSIYANRVIEEEVMQQNKIKLVKKPAARAWLEWAGRAEVSKITYLPGAPRIVEGEFNTWNGWGMKNGSVAKGDTTLWRKLIEHLFNGEDYTWFEQWLAYPLQHPGTKLFSAVIMWGLIHGTGKSLVGATMRRIYGSNFVEIQDQHIIGGFNDWAINKQFVMGDEITGGDKRALGDRMKSLITQQYIRVNQKYVPTYEIPDCINYYFTSNHPDSFFIEDNDRRYYVQECKGGVLPEQFYADYDVWYKSLGVGALFYYLLNVDLTGFNPNAAAPLTLAKADMLGLGRSDAASWVAMLREYPDQTLKIGDRVFKYSLMTCNEIHYLYDPDDHKRLTINGMGRELRRGGFTMVNDGRTVTTAAGPQRLWAVRNREESRRMSHRLLVETYNKERQEPFVKGVKY